MTDSIDRAANQAKAAAAGKSVGVDGADMTDAGSHMGDAPMPPGWDKTHEDLMAEMKSGKRPSIGRAELQWATQYEQGLLPSTIRFPRVGEVYEAVRDADVHFEIYFQAPVTDGGEGRLLKGERLRITYVWPKDRPVRALARPLQYRKVQDRFVPEARREPPYGHYAIVLKTADLDGGFDRVAKWSLRNLALLAGDAFRSRQPRT